MTMSENDFSGAGYEVELTNNGSRVKVGLHRSATEGVTLELLPSQVRQIAQAMLAVLTTARMDKAFVATPIPIRGVGFTRTAQGEALLSLQSNDLHIEFVLPDDILSQLADKLAAEAAGPRPPKALQ